MALQIPSTVSSIQGVIGKYGNIYNAFMSQYAQDVVTLINQDGQPVGIARAMKCNVVESSKLCDHPIEDGSTISDFKIQLPIEIELIVAVAPQYYSSLYASAQRCKNTSKVLTLQTRAAVYTNLQLVSFAHEETPDVLDVLFLAMKLRQVVVISTQYQALPPAAVKNQTDTSTVQTGAKQPQNSILYNIFKN